MSILKLEPEKESSLCAKLKINQLKEIQKNVIFCLLSGENCMLVSQPGSGKSICYQFPALYLPGSAIVISPLIALMKDQIEQLHNLNIYAAKITHETEMSEKIGILNDLVSGSLKLLYVSPERFVDQSFLYIVQRAKISFVAIDEAHCLTSWGKTFRPEYMKIGIAIRTINKTTIALTATADYLTRSEIGSILNIEPKNCFVADFMETNVRHSIEQKRNPMLQLFGAIKYKKNPAIVYCSTRKAVEDIASKINEAFPSRATIYHAGLTDKIRNNNQMDFLNDEKKIMVATIAFGMGINKPNVRLVFNYNTPTTIEDYFQFTGRAGRDGNQSKACTLFGNGDIRAFHSLLQRNEKISGSEVDIWRFDQLVTFYKAIYCRHWMLSRALGANVDYLPKYCGNCDNCIIQPMGSDVFDVAIAICRWLKEKSIASIAEIEHFAAKFKNSESFCRSSNSGYQSHSFIVRQLALFNFITLCNSEPILLRVNMDYYETITNKMGHFFIPLNITNRP